MAGTDGSINARRWFKLLSDFNDKAVMDRETGLVWERQSSNQTFVWPHTVLNKRLWENVGIGGATIARRRSFGKSCA